MVRNALCIFLLLVFQALQAQDSLKVLTLDALFVVILKNHPIARQAALLDEKAKQELRISKGLLDPKLNSAFYQKEFQDDAYYTLMNSYLSIPTWYGIEFQAGYERNTGNYVNNESQTPFQGLSYISISVPIGQGLFIDERRAQIRQARQFSTIARADQLNMINKLLLQAAKDYWDWMFYYNKWNLYKEGLELASLRYEAVLEQVRFGDLPPIDTAEAMMQVQNFELLFTQAELEYRNYSLILSNYLWNEDGVPLELKSTLIPSERGAEITPLEGDSLTRLVELAKINHPDIVKLNAKLAQLKIERSYLADRFKPKIDLNYTLLQTGFNANGNMFSGSYPGNNYRLSLNFSYPIFLRQERGKFQLTKLEIQETGYSLQLSKREIENSIHAYANEWIALEKQLLIQERLVKNSEMLREGELLRFENGESSLFLVNSRETALIASQLKLFEIKAKYAKSKVLLRWAAGSVN